MAAVRGLWTRIGEYIVTITEGNANLTFVHKVFNEVLDFWENASESDQFKFGSRIVVFTSQFAYLVYQFVTRDNCDADFDMMRSTLLIHHIAEEQLKAIKEFYNASEALYVLEIEHYIDLFLLRKLERLHKIPREVFHEDLLLILESSTSNKGLKFKNWIRLFYIPDMREGLPHGPCLAAVKGNIGRGPKRLQARLEQIPTLAQPMAENELEEVCVFCSQTILSYQKYILIDCCTHLICSKCKKLHSWKLW